LIQQGCLATALYSGLGTIDVGMAACVDWALK
jgi:hypothetical protein